MEIVLRPPDRRGRDVDNFHKAILDALEHAEVYHNDNQVRDLRIRWDVSETGQIITTPGGRAVIRIEPLVFTAELLDKHERKEVEF
jgi:crossover junction endodeoxyribonuclease RusA